MNGILKAAHVEKQAVNAAELALINKLATIRWIGIMNGLRTRPWRGWLRCLSENLC